jgi:SAM-dependent methyltransferase
MQSNQDEVFAAYEGNNWFQRNRSVLEHFDPEADLPLKLMKLYQMNPRTVLEVGAANGYRLAEISQQHGTKVVAVEPSREAILDGRLRFPRVEFVQGVASAIPLERSFDVIIVNGVFCWMERTTLLRSVAEIDRLLLDKGFLIIGDFYPSNQLKTHYHHLADQEMYTYKQDYAAPFLSSGLYRTVCLLTADHSSKALETDVPENDRFGTWLLRKSVNDLYELKSMSG